MTADLALPPAMFDIDTDGDMSPPVFEPAGHGVALTPYRAHEGLGPGVWADFPSLCGEALYGALTVAGRRVWIWHACSTHHGDHHKCDRCEVTW